MASSGEFVDIHAVFQPPRETGIQTEGLPEDVIGQLRHRIRELEAEVQQRNAELQVKDSLKRNYEATLEKLMKVQTEKQVIEEDRENYCEEMKHYRQQAEEKTKENDMYQERLQDMARQRTNEDKRIKELENKICFWKGKCENHEAEVKENRPSMKGDTSQTCFNQRTGTGCQPKRRRHTFHQSPTVLPRCKNCLTAFDRIQPQDIQCRFHRSGPQPLKTWKKLLHTGLYVLAMLRTSGTEGATGMLETPIT